jgi:septal ring factor EnvC (AmiA/AmiB activator)
LVWLVVLGWFWWLALPLPLTAQPTPLELLPGVLSPSERLAWSKVSEALLTRLNERRVQIASLQDSLLTLNSELTGSQLESEGLKTQLDASEESRQALQKELTATLNSLADLQRDYLALKASVDQAKAEDQKALSSARAERDWWMMGAAASGGLAVVVAILAMWK